MRLWAAARVPAARHSFTPTNVGEPASSTSQAGRTNNPYCLGPLSLREITPESVARWQAERLAIGGGPVAVREALKLLGSILQRAVEAQHIETNPVRAVRRAPLPHRPRCDRWHRLSSRRCAPPPARGTRLCSVSSLTRGSAQERRSHFGGATSDTRRCWSNERSRSEWKRTRRRQRTERCVSLRHSQPTFANGGCTAAARQTQLSSSRRRRARHGPMPHTAHGGAVRSGARSRRPVSSEPARMTSAIPSPRSCCTRGRR